MKKVNSYKLMLLTLLISGSSRAFFQESLDDFVGRMTKDKFEQEEFRAYYSNFLDRQSRLSTKRKRKKLRRLRQDGLASLELKNKKYYKMLADHSELNLDGQSRNTRLFLVRYRLFEDFQQNKNAKHVHLWNKTKTFAVDLTKKAVDLGKSLKETVYAQIA